MNYLPRILIIDDDPALLEQAELLLYDAYQISLARSGAQALAYLERSPDADLILLDILMPEMDGFQTLREIRTLPGCRSVPVIFLTSLSDPDWELQGLSAGAEDYICKPFDSRVLLARVQRTLAASFPLDEDKLLTLPEPLSDTEWRVAKLMARSYSNEDICTELHYALDTVKKIVSRVLEKLRIKSRKEIKKFLK